MVSEAVRRRFPFHLSVKAAVTPVGPAKKASQGQCAGAAGGACSASPLVGSAGAMPITSPKAPSCWIKSAAV